VTADPSRSTIPQRLPSRVLAPRVRLVSIRLSEARFAFFLVLPALPEEVALHEQYLDTMEKEAKRPSLWRKLAA